MANVDIRVGKKDSTFFSANPTLILKDGQFIFNETTSELFIGDGVTQLSSLVAINGASYTLTASEIGSVINGTTDATPNDTDLVISVESSVAKKNTWAQIKSFLKTYFDTIYITKWVSGSAGFFSIKADNDSGLDATGDYAVAEGYGTLANAPASHAEGVQTTASGNASHAEGDYTIASGNASHSEGNGSVASGEASHAGGYQSTASGDFSFVHGNNSTASGTNTVVLGADINGTADDTTYVDKLNIKRDITAQTLTASQIVETDSNKKLISAAKGTAYNKNFGTTSGTVLEGNRITQTITNGVTDKAPSEDAVFDALATKVDTFMLQTAAIAFNPADATTYYMGIFAIAPTTTASTFGFKIGYNFRVVGAIILCVNNGTAGSTENNTLNFRNITTSTSSVISNTLKTNATSTAAIHTTVTGLNITGSANDDICIEWITPTWVTNPTTCTFLLRLYIERLP